MSSPKDPPLKEFDLLATDAGFDEKVEGVCDLFTVNCILEDTTSPAITRGREGLRDFMKILLTGLPDFGVEPEEIFEIGNTSIMVLNISGTHVGEFMGYPPTGKRIEWRAVAIYRCNADCSQVHHETWAYDAAGISAQIEGDNQ